MPVEWCEQEVARSRGKRKKQTRTEEKRNNESLNKEAKKNSRKREYKRDTKRRIHFHLIRCVDLNTDSLFIDLSLVQCISNQNGASHAFYDGWSFWLALRGSFYTLPFLKLCPSFGIAEELVRKMYKKNIEIAQRIISWYWWWS